jgi:hypothetical protein
MAEGLIYEAQVAAAHREVGAEVFSHLSRAIGGYLEVPAPAQELPGWSNLTKDGRASFAERFNQWASVFTAADVAVRSAVALQLPSADELNSALAMYNEIGPVYGTERTWLMAAYAQTCTLVAEPTDLVESLRAQTECVIEDKSASLAPFWRWQRGRLRKQWFYEEKQPVIISGAALLDQWWDWQREVGDFGEEVEGTPTLYEQGMDALRDVQRVLIGI